MYKSILLVFFIAASCGTPKNGTQTVEAEQIENITTIQEGTITLALGEQEMVGDIMVHFKEVLEDSRCPTGTNCFWQGRAKILLETSEDGMTVDRSELIFGELKEGETKNHTFYKRGNTTITATAINPYPTKETGTVNLPYELVFKVQTK
ncbi:hypothetical protein [Marinirhabdus gelatinilytica]|uniref:Uncharacterized protein n=1 Tax=Marinirhabdus gelatinilytica TaxID=1703343 RepID=A0A370QJ68_9FLAO|nr:hypothetical protein [Marinirhabdus gelatinilytica]RDK88386.1 hypothetical protein C8D94_101257 [Marinirhabdus gelatinilytica]